MTLLPFGLFAIGGIIALVAIVALVTYPELSKEKDVIRMNDEFEVELDFLFNPISEFSYFDERRGRYRQSGE